MKRNSKNKLVATATGIALALCPMAAFAGTVANYAEYHPGTSKAHATLTAQCAGPTPEQVEYIMVEDSKGWNFNWYNQGTAYNAGLVQGSYCDYEFWFRIDYTYNDGSHGTVNVRSIDGYVDCMQYHDMFGTCRPQNTYGNNYGRGNGGYDGGNDGGYNGGGSQRMCPGYTGPEGTPIYVPC